MSVATAVPTEAPATPAGADPVRVAVIIASTRDGRFGPVVTKWFTERAAAHPGVEIDTIDLLEADLPLTMTGFGQPRPAAVEALAPRLAAADAFAIVTPEYNHSFPAALKNAIDWYNAEWRAKPVGFVSYGGVSGGLRAVQQLRQVFTELHAVNIRDVVSLHNIWELFAEDGTWPVPSERRDVAVGTLVEQLVWFARTLREGRAARAYAA